MRYNGTVGDARNTAPLARDGGGDLEKFKLRHQNVKLIKCHVSHTQAMVQETKRAVTELGMAGVALFVGPTAKPPDLPCFEGLYRTCQELDATIWVHPCRPQSYADYDAYKV